MMTRQTGRQKDKISYPSEHTYHWILQEDKTKLITYKTNVFITSCEIIKEN